MVEVTDEEYKRIIIKLMEYGVGTCDIPNMDDLVSIIPQSKRVRTIVSLAEEINYEEMKDTPNHKYLKQEIFSLLEDTGFEVKGFKNIIGVISRSEDLTKKNLINILMDKFPDQKIKYEELPRFPGILLAFPTGEMFRVSFTNVSNKAPPTNTGFNYHYSGYPKEPMTLMGDESNGGFPIFPSSELPPPPDIIGFDESSHPAPNSTGINDGSHPPRPDLTESHEDPVSPGKKGDKKLKESLDQEVKAIYVRLKKSWKDEEL